jgi:hypothetical protein
MTTLVELIERVEACEGADIDPAWEMMPRDQIERVLGQEYCDIEPAFLGFTDVYLMLAAIIPRHWTIVDLGCAYAPQAILFANHKSYVGVDISDCEKFSAPNSKHYTMPIADFIEQHSASFDQQRTFGICSYVPPWHGSDNIDIARRAFRHVFTYYPSSDPDTRLPFRAGRP